MRIYLTVILILLALAGVAQGVTSVYGPISSLFSGSSTGVETTVIIGNAGEGDTTLVSVPAGSRYLLTRYDFKPAGADTTGTTNLQIGSDNVYSINNALADNVYGKNLTPNYNIGADGEDLIINVPAGADIYYNIDGITVTGSL
jgi:hypothetical protein